MTGRRARTTATHFLRHSFLAIKETPSNILRTCKPRHIYLLACCLCLSVLKYGRDGTRVLLLAARTGCVERGWMDEREALLRLLHVMMLCFPSSLDCLTTPSPCPRPRPCACACMLEGVAVGFGVAGWIGWWRDEGKGKKERSEGRRGQAQRTLARPLTPSTNTHKHTGTHHPCCS